MLSYIISNLVIYIVVFLLLWIVPGSLIFCLLFRNEKLQIIERITISSLINLSLLPIIALFLAKLHLFCRIILIPVIACICLIVFLLIIFSERNPLKNMKRIIGLKISCSQFSNLLLPFLLILVVTGFQGLATFMINKGASAPSWRYLADSLLIVKLGGLPETSYQWLTVTPFITNKLFFYLFSATHLVLLEGVIDHILFMELFTIFTLFFSMVFSYSLFREVFNEVTGALALIFIFINPFFASVFTEVYTSFKSEAFAVMLMFGIIYLFLKWWRDFSWKFFILSLVTLCIQSLVHLVPFGCTIIYLFCFAIIDFLIKREKKIFLLLLRTIIIIILAIAFAWFVPKLAVSGGDPYQSVTLDDSIYKPYNGYDPTYEFLSKLTVGDHRKIKLQGFYTDPLSLYSRIFTSTITIRTIPPISNFLPLVSTIALFLILFVSPRLMKKHDIRIFVWSSILSSLLLYIMSLFFSYKYSVWVLASFIETRFFSYISWMHITIICALFYYLLYFSDKLISKVKRIHIGARKWNLLLNNNCARLLSCLIILFFLLSIFIPQWLPYLKESRPLELSSDAYAALMWIKENTSQEDIILINERTTGIVEVLAERKAVIEGLATYLQPKLLNKSLFMLDEVENFYLMLNPIALCKYNVDYVIVSKVINAFMGHTPKRIREAIKKGNLPDFDTLPYLKKLQTFGKISIYKVDRSLLFLTCFSNHQENSSLLMLSAN